MIYISSDYDIEAVDSEAKIIRHKCKQFRLLTKDLYMALCRKVSRALTPEGVNCVTEAGILLSRADLLSALREMNVSDKTIKLVESGQL